MNGAAQADIAFFLATSGHSGVDRLMGNLIREIARRGYHIDLLRVRGHGPHIAPLPNHVRCIDLGSRHVNSSLPGLVRYLKKASPRALLSDKDRLNRMALFATRLARVNTTVAVRIGTTVSINLENRGWGERRLQYASIRHLYPHADSIIVPSRGAGDDLNHIAGRVLPHLHVLPSPVISQHFEQLCRAPAHHPWLTDKRRPLVLAVGELSRRKDFTTLIQAFRHLASSGDPRLIIIGEGRQRQRLEQLVARCGLESRVALPGFIPNPYPFMASADLFVLSSLWEGSPVVLVEALAAGVPVVATDCPSGPREVLQDGRLGPLTPVGNADALAQAMQDILAKPPRRIALQAAAAPFHVVSATDGYLSAMRIGQPKPPKAFDQDPLNGRSMP